jgi:hypothetical protein
VTARGGVEPDVHITTDKKWVVFTGQFGQLSSMSSLSLLPGGQRHVYAVDIEKAKYK